MTKKVLIIITTSFVPYGGLTTVMMNYYRAMDKTGLQIDFASTNEPPQVLLDELHQNGSEYYCLGDRKRRLPQYLAKLKRILRKKQYDVVHVNGNSTTMAFELGTASACGVPMRVAHGHNMNTLHPMIHAILRRPFMRSCTHAISVSDRAGDWLYGAGNYIVLNNAVDVKRYRFNEVDRKEYRREFAIEDRFAVGHVGKLYPVKNHDFLLAIFAQLRQKRPDAVLLLVGDGELRYTLEKRSAELGIEKHVIFAGMRSDVAQFLQAMDIFVFPSFYEGNPLAMIEAQASGLPCLVSANITRDACCTEHVVYKSIEDSAADWADEILRMSKESYERGVDAEVVRKSGFDIAAEAEKLRDLYIQM